MLCNRRDVTDLNLPTFFDRIYTIDMIEPNRPVQTLFGDLNRVNPVNPVLVPISLTHGFEATRFIRPNPFDSQITPTGPNPPKS
jgi:hypothetical protein